MEPEATTQEITEADAQSRLDAMSAQLEALGQERDAAIAAATQAAAERAALAERANDLEAAHLGAVRRSLLAENAGQVVPELVQGSTSQELEASVQRARDAYERIVADLRIHAAGQVPIGASAGAAPQLDELTPMQKLTQALSRNGQRS